MFRICLQSSIQLCRKWVPLKCLTKELNYLNIRFGVLDDIAEIGNLVKIVEVQTAQIAQRSEEMAALDAMVSSHQGKILDLNTMVVRQKTKSQNLDTTVTSLASIFFFEDRTCSLNFKLSCIYKVWRRYTCPIWGLRVALFWVSGNFSSGF